MANEATGGPRTRQNREDDRIHIKISRSGKQRKIKGIHDKMAAGRRNISINGTGV